MRKPFFWTRQKAWYVKSDDGKKNVFLSTDEKEAQEIWKQAHRLGTPITRDGMQPAKSRFIRVVRDRDKQEVFVNVEHVSRIEIDEKSRYRLFVAGEDVEFTPAADGRVARVLEVICQNAIRD